MGQLGDGTTSPASRPERIGTATDWATVSVGLGYYAHTCGIRTDKTLWCWGSNFFGHLGDGSRTDSHVPVRIGTAANWTALAAGAGHTCGVRSGALWCWGNNDYGQIGDGSGTERLSPVQIGTATDWTTVVTSANHACGLRSGALWCWGNNDFGQIGVGVFGGNYLVPTPTWVPRPTSRCSRPARPHLRAAIRHSVVLGRQRRGPARRRHADQSEHAVPGRHRHELGERRCRRHGHDGAQERIAPTGNCGSNLTGIAPGSRSSGRDDAHHVRLRRPPPGTHSLSSPATPSSDIRRAHAWVILRAAAP